MSSKEWREIELGDIVKIKGRIGWKGYKTSDLREYGPIVLGGNNIKNSLYLDLHDVKHLSREKYEESPEIKLKADDILVVTRGNGIGDVSFFNCEIEEATINPSMVILSDCTNDSKFLFYYLISPKGRANLLSVSSGSSIPAIYQKSLNTISFSVPSMPEQKIIADTLSCLDDMIELNNRTNQILEEMAKAIFKRWFVDFEFPNEDGEPYKSSGGEMVDSELGEIPKGWRVETLGDISKVVTKGTTPTTLKKQFVTKGINFVKAESITDDHYIDSGKFAFIDEETNQLLNRSKIEENDILFTMAGTIGRFALVKRDVLPANTNQAVAIIRIDASKVHPLFVYCGFLCELHSNYYFKRIQQAVQPNLNLSTIKSLPLVIPQKMVLNTFIKFITQLFNEMDNSQRLSMNLFKLRDTLLPKLMSGEMRVPIEEVV